MSEPTKHLDFLVGLLHAIAASHQGNVMLVGNVRAEQIVEICKHTVALTQRAEAAEAERDVLAEKWGDMVDDHGDPLDASGILEYVCTLREELSHMKAERDKLRTVYKAAAVYCGDRTVANEHALIDAVGEIRALAVQP